MIGRTPIKSHNNSEEKHSQEVSENLTRQQRIQKKPYWDTSALEAIRKTLPEESKVTRSKVHIVGSANQRTSPIKTRSTPPKEPPTVVPKSGAFAFTIENTPVSVGNVRRSPRLNKSPTVTEPTLLNETVTIAKELATEAIDINNISENSAGSNILNITDEPASDHARNEDISVQEETQSNTIISREIIAEKPKETEESLFAGFSTDFYLNMATANSDTTTHLRVTVCGKEFDLVKIT
jgi:hypothetical protein